MSEIDPEKIVAELEATRLARRLHGDAFPIRHRRLLIAVAIVITLLILALFVFSFFLGGRAAPVESAAPAQVRNFSFAQSPATS